MSENLNSAVPPSPDAVRLQELAALQALFGLDPSEHSEMQRLLESTAGSTRQAEARDGFAGELTDEFAGIIAAVDCGLTYSHLTPLPPQLRNRLVAEWQIQGDSGRADLGQADLGQGDLGQGDSGQSDSGRAVLGQAAVRESISASDDQASGRWMAAPSTSSTEPAGGASAGVSLSRAGHVDRFDRSGASAMPFHLRESVAWVLATACGLLALVGWMGRPPAPTEFVKNAPVLVPQDAAMAYAKDLYLAMEPLAGSSNVVRVGWKDPDGNELPGDMIWDRQKQMGVMRLVKLPVDAGADEDYQLWIFDPARKERGDKVDRVGGPVFSLAENATETFILVQSPLHLLDVGVFAITVEPAAGVVESKLEKIAALSDAVNGSL